MRYGMRRLLKARYLAPVAMMGCVGIVGLLGFSASATSAAATPTTTVPKLVASDGKSTPVSHDRSTKNESSVLANNDGLSDADQAGIFYASLPKSFIAPGQALFAANCSSCHGPEALGTVRAPNLQGLGSGTVDFWVSTGRMPLANSSVQATRKPARFNRLQTLELAAWVQSLTPGEGTQVPIVNTNKADLEAGNTLFTLNCAACHTITGAGDALAGGSVAPSLHLATPTQTVEAIRSGPGDMPHFSPGNI